MRAGQHIRLLPSSRPRSGMDGSASPAHWRAAAVCALWPAASRDGRGHRAASFPQQKAVLMAAHPHPCALARQTAPLSDLRALAACALSDDKIRSIPCRLPAFIHACAPVRARKPAQLHAVILLSKSFRKASVPSAEQQGLQDFGGNASGSMPVYSSP